MNPSFLWQLIPYASRIAKAAETIQKLEADPDVQDAIKLAEELGALIAKASQPQQSG
jgi:hypothetical protein